MPRLGEVLPASFEVLEISQCEPNILDQVRELLEQLQQGERSNFLLLTRIIIDDDDDDLRPAGAGDTCCPGDLPKGIGTC